MPSAEPRPWGPPLRTALAVTESNPRGAPKNSNLEAPTRCVNVLLYAFRSDSVDHAEYRTWLDDLVNGDEAFGMSPQVLCSVARIATHPRVFVSPSRLDDVLAFARVMLEQPHCTAIAPGMRHFAIFENLCRAAAVTGLSLIHI